MPARAQGARCWGHPTHRRTIRFGGSAWLDPQCGEGCRWLCGFTPVSLPPPRLPSVCEINVLSVWVSAAFVFPSPPPFTRRRVKRTCGLSFMPASLAFQIRDAVSLWTALAPGWEGWSAGLEASVALTLFDERRKSEGWALAIVGGGDQPCPQASVQLMQIDCIWPLVLPGGIHRLFRSGPWNPSFMCSFLQHPMPEANMTSPWACPAPPTTVNLLQPPVPLKPATHTSVHTFKRPGQLAALSTR